MDQTLHAQGVPRTPGYRDARPHGVGDVRTIVTYDVDREGLA
ncbi:MAG: hypothetical protein QOI57_1878 [Rubrobacteraceae bacterium]|nr:hypothetical protein [Rubrobacteraceae bacterium]